MFAQNPRWWLYRIFSQTVRMPDLHGILLAFTLINMTDRSLHCVGIALFTVSFGNWALLSWVGLQKGRASVVVYPLFQIFLPVFNVMVRIYTMMTVRQRTWGGSRAGVEFK
jgi:hypothetical protein